MALRRMQVATALAAIVAVLAVAATRAAGQSLLITALAACTLPAVATGALLVRAVPTSPVGPSLAWSGGAVAVGLLVDALVASADGGHRLLLGESVRPIAVGMWPVNLAGVFALLLVFPDGPLRHRLWPLLPWLYAACTLGVVAALWGVRQVDGHLVVGYGPGRATVLLGSMVGIATCLISALASVAIRYRTGDPRRRAQIRWLMLAGSVVMVLLVGGWAAGVTGARIETAYAPFIVATIVLTPLAVAVAVVREDLFDIDRLLSSTAAWVLTGLIATVAYGSLLLVVDRALHVGDALGPTAAAFVTALALLPLHRLLLQVIGAVVDREQTVALATVRRFEADVRMGSRAPEDIERVLRETQHDDGLALYLHRDGEEWVRVDGSAAADPMGIPVESCGEQIARIHIGWNSARARRRVTELAAASWVSIEVSRLRVGLRTALTDLQMTHERLNQVAASERRRLERDLHDGVQQRLVATGMRLRLVQRRLPDGAAWSEIEAAVEELQETVEELRRLAQGVRPSRLDDGLGAALEAVRQDSPLPLDLVVERVPALDEGRALAAYLIVAEAVANALKHAHARRLSVRVTGEGDGVRIQVGDDGDGGLGPDEPVMLRDRVHAVGGRLSVRSPAGHGTTIEVVL